MRGGKSILLIIGGLLVAGFVAPSWSWWIERYWDSAAQGQHSPLAIMGRAIAMIAPVQQFFFGAASGMSLALLIGYWEEIRAGAITSASLFGMAWRAIPDVFPSAEFEVDFTEAETRKEIVVPKNLKIRRILCTPGWYCYCDFIKENTFSLTRGAAPARAEMRVRVEIFGRYKFWQTLGLWRSLRLSALPLTSEQRWAALGYLSGDILIDGVPARQLPLDIGPEK